MAITDVFTSALDGAWALAGSVVWGPFVKFSRTAVLSLLQKIEAGQLLVREDDGTEIVCGRVGVDQTLKTQLRIHRETFWVRLALFADMVSFEFP